MGQLLLSLVLFFAFISSMYAFFAPQHPSSGNSFLYNSGEELKEDSQIRKSQQWSMSTRNGVIEVNKDIDFLTKKEKKLKGMTEEDRQKLEKMNRQMEGILNKEGVKNEQDILKLKMLGIEKENDERILNLHTKQLEDLNEELNEKRQKAAEDRGLINLNSESSYHSLQQQNNMLNERSASFIDNVSQKNNDAIEHTKDLIEDQRQRLEDQRNR